MSFATRSLLDQMDPLWRLIFPRRSSPGSFYSSTRCGATHARSEFAILVLDVVIRALRAHGDQAAVQSMLVSETETLLDRLDLVKVELQLALAPPVQQHRQALEVLLIGRMLITLAVATGDLRDVIYLHRQPGSSLYEYLGLVCEQLRGLLGDLPDAKEAAHA